MSRGSLVISSTSQDINVSVDQIIGDGGADSPKIIIPIKMDLHPLSNGYQSDPSPFEVLLVKAELKATEKNFRLSETTLIDNTKVLSNTNGYYNFQFPVTNEIINRVEKYRKGNIQFQVHVWMQVGVYDISQAHFKKLETYIDKRNVIGFNSGYGYASFNIEQSQWVNNILPRLGHNSYKLIEIPAVNQIIPLEYKVSLKEFEEAQKYFLNGDYDKTVAHCRAALDPFSGPRNLPKLKEFVKSKSEFEWATKVLESTEEWLEKVIKATSSFTSKTHHAPSVGHFSRNEAEIVLMITTGIIAYIGKIEYKPN